MPSDQAPIFVDARPLDVGRTRRATAVSFCCGERTERFLDLAAEPRVFGGRDLQVFWNGVPHVEDQDNPDDKDWAANEPDPEAL